jgi:hypothetical protein
MNKGRQNDPKTGSAVTKRALRRLLPAACCLLLAACELYAYGLLGGADFTRAYTPGTLGNGTFEAALGDLSGVWYSHWAGIGRLDGYRIGTWSEFGDLMIETNKIDRIPGIGDDPLNAVTYTGYAPKPDDYFVFYDSSVYGQKDDTSEPDPTWQHNFGFCGIVRALNLFYDIPERGAIIIEYLEGCYPDWLTRTQGLKEGEKPFFGIYYRVLEPDIVQMANAVNLEALYKGEKYYTETATLQEAIDSNTVENEAEYIAWGVVIPQDREP